MKKPNIAASHGPCRFYLKAAEAPLESNVRRLLLASIAHAEQQTGPGAARLAGLREALAIYDNWERTDRGLEFAQNYDAEGRPRSEILYLIFNINRDAHVGYNDGCILWWGPERCGYRNTVDEAGRYTRDEAQSICGSSCGELRAVREDVVLKASKTRTHCWLNDLPGDAYPRIEREDRAA